MTHYLAMDKFQNLIKFIGRKVFRMRIKQCFLGTGKLFYIYCIGWPLPCVVLSLFTFDIKGACFI